MQYMLQCGMLIPMHERSHAGIFSSIFIDIGDEQSIEKGTTFFPCLASDSCNKGCTAIVQSSNCSFSMAGFRLLVCMAKLSPHQYEDNDEKLQ